MKKLKKQPFGGVMDPEDVVEPILMYATRHIPQPTMDAPSGQLN